MGRGGKRTGAGRPPRSRTPEYQAWIDMRRRCTNPNNADWKQYGGRGIKVCDRWIESFDNFLADMGPRPSPKHSIGRFPNNDGNYEPRNCRWATAAEQHFGFVPAEADLRRVGLRRSRDGRPTSTWAADAHVRLGVEHDGLRRPT